MTNRERKDFYLKRIKRILVSHRNFNTIIPGTKAKKLEEEMRIIMRNNSREWTDNFMKEEVIPLLRKYGIKC